MTDNAMSAFPACLRSDPAIALWAVSPSMELIAASENAAQTLFGKSIDEVVGRHLKQILPDRAADRVQDVCASAKARSGPVVGREVWRDRRVRSIYTPHDHPAGSVFVVTRPDPLTRIPDPTPEHLNEADFLLLDEFSALTPKELQVLAYFGQGMRIATIAEHMGRSPKTIDNHKARLSQKLGVNSRAELMSIAREAGIEPQMANLPRVRFQPPSVN